MATPSHFLNQIKDQFYKTKIELAIEWETHWAAEMRGPQPANKWSQTHDCYPHGQLLAIKTLEEHEKRYNLISIKNQ